MSALFLCLVAIACGVLIPAVVILALCIWAVWWKRSRTTSVDLEQLGQTGIPAIEKPTGNDHNEETNKTHLNSQSRESLNAPDEEAQAAEIDVIILKDIEPPTADNQESDEDNSQSRESINAPDEKAQTAENDVVDLKEIEPSTEKNQESGDKNEEKEEGPVYHKLEDTDEAESK